MCRYPSPAPPRPDLRAEAGEPWTAAPLDDRRCTGPRGRPGVSSHIGRAWWCAPILLGSPGQGTGAWSGTAATETPLSRQLGGGILQAPWPNHALQPTPWIAAAFPSRLVRRGSFLFRWTDGPAFNSPEGLAV
jgi:hypothetical protein